MKRANWKVLSFLVIAAMVTGPAACTSYVPSADEQDLATSRFADNSDRVLISVLRWIDRGQRGVPSFVYDTQLILTALVHLEAHRRVIDDRSLPADAIVSESGFAATRGEVPGVLADFIACGYLHATDEDADEVHACATGFASEQTVARVATSTTTSGSGAGGNPYVLIAWLIAYPAADYLGGRLGDNSELAEEARRRAEEAREALEELLERERERLQREEELRQSLETNNSASQQGYIDRIRRLQRLRERQEDAGNDGGADAGTGNGGS